VCDAHTHRFDVQTMRVYNGDTMLEVRALPALCHPALASEAGVRAAFVFGSVARGKARPDSDVDIAVVGHGIDTLSLAATLGTALRCEVDVVEIGLQSPIPLLRSVLRDGRRIYERDGGAAAEFLSRARSVVELDGPAHDRMMQTFMKRVAERGVGS